MGDECGRWLGDAWAINRTPPPCLPSLPPLPTSLLPCLPHPSPRSLPPLPPLCPPGPSTCWSRAGAGAGLGGFNGGDTVIQIG